MKNIIVRKIDDALHKLLKKRAIDLEMSVNELMHRLIEREVKKEVGK